MPQKVEKAAFTTILEFEVMETTFGNNDDNTQLGRGSSGQFFILVWNIV